MKLLKTIARIIMALFGKKKTFDLDGDGKVESLREEISGVFSQFKKMNDKLNDVNEKLQVIIEDEKVAKQKEEEELKKIIASAEAKLAQSDKVIDKAFSEIQANQKLQEKVSEFIV